LFSIGSHVDVVVSPIELLTAPFTVDVGNLFTASIHFLAPDNFIEEPRKTMASMFTDEENTNSLQPNRTKTSHNRQWEAELRMWDYLLQPQLV
jgi:hypothetical protein